MKKFLVVVAFALVAMFAFAACGQPAAETPSAEAPAESSEAPVESSEAPVESSEAPSEEPSEAPSEEAASGGNDIAALSAEWGFTEEMMNLINPETGEQWKIGIANMGTTSEYGNKLATAYQTYADSLGLKIDLVNAEFDTNTQLGQMDTLIANGVDIILMTPVDASAMTNPLEAAAEAGIPVICVNTMVDDPTLAECYVGSDDIEVGENVATWLFEEMGGEGGIVILKGVLGMSSEVNRTTGIEQALANYPNIEVLADKTGNWNRDEGMLTMENWIQSFGSDIKGVLAENDEMAIGATSALQAAGMDQDVLVVGVDGLQDALPLIEEGAMNCTYLQDATMQGQVGIQVALRKLNGGDLIDAYNVPWAIITKENVADFYA
ncbi:MAG: substrate-binding domain-containing protein [Christensenellaceae bacterium]|jgi:ABC-type sugar transport system substrate-binding protein